MGRAVQDLAAARLGRGFLPLAVLALLGLGRVLVDGPGASGLAILVGAPASGVAMLAYGLRAVQISFGRRRRRWMGVAAIGSLVPPGYALWVLAWPGLRTIARWEGPGPVIVGVVYLALGAWALRAWIRLLELQRLAVTMRLDATELEGGA
ncbi:MAG: hypothetical protein PVJ02_04655 [Gemmatimonadota bacterium]